MPNLYLGPSGSEVTLPTLTGIGSAVADAPVRLEKIANESRQSDGSKRFGVIAIKRQWSYNWAFLSEEDKEIIEALYSLTEPLHFKDEFEGDTWYDVYFAVFTFAELRGISSDTNKHYSVSIVLEEL